MHLKSVQTLLFAVLAFCFCSVASSNANALKYVKLQEQAPCAPWTVAPQERCSYVIEHKQSCYPDGGWQAYLRIHFCTFAGYWEYMSLILLLLGAVLFFFMLLTVSERFFCPALELISEYLRLPPAVAGATLLSFGNGAPDIFTQVAAVGQGGSAAVGMALAEPLGGGLFTSNIVFGCVVLVASRAANVSIQRWSFMKDVAFYLLSLLMIAFILIDHKVLLWEAAVMGAVYTAYVCTTFYISRHDEPVRADVALHEVPQEEGVDLPDSCSDCYTDLPEHYPIAVQHFDRSTSMHSFEAVTPPAATSGHGHSYGYHHLPSDATAVTVHAPPPPVLLHSSSLRSVRHQLKEPLLSPVEESSYSNSGTGAPAKAAAAAEVTAADNALAAAAAFSNVATVTNGPAPAGAEDPAEQTAEAPAGAADAAVQASFDTSPQSARTLRRFKTFTEGVTVPAAVQYESEEPGSSPGESPAGRFGRSVSFRPRMNADTTSLLSPRGARAVSEGGAFTPRYPRSPGGPRVASSVASGGDIFEAASRGVSPRDETPYLQSLQQMLLEHHQSEQEELLRKQYEEHLALVELHEEAQATKMSKSWATRVKHRMQQPLFQVLSCTMPKVGTGHGHHYQRWRACLLPVTAPLTLFLASPSLWDSVGTPGLLYSLLCAAVASAIIFSTYPTSNVPRKTLKGVFAVMSFVQAICWLNICAGSLVQICIMLGVIFGVTPALLGATVLAWGNTVPDLINNLALARDGFPSMAVAACFASPLFTLMVGMGGAMAYGAYLNHGVLAVPIDGPLLVMIAFGVVNLVKFMLIIPLVFKFQMKRSIAVMAFLYYACFNVVYGLVISGVIRIPIPKV